ncbi:MULTISPECIES: glycoside hydrolase family 43 protein [unclassified Microbacterium]|uniref:glycoside hydrolase family 43 protein n=1 Tax=unclassified Microbacterium TaxID=2609290 RepID=UPI0012FCCE4F|nr:glycoside hydrolase family 43 protein [Microbacterium sp. MAH-37]MVQ41471.1 1,4-beta-xylanase [Microbacterium sp. MAH-37]
MAPTGEYAGYLYVHFKREAAEGEQIHFALSDGNDPLRFADLNDGRPVVRSKVGQRGVRDPHVVRSPVNGRYYMVATDLRLYDSMDWDHHQRWGSRSIVVWESADLIEWGDGRLVEVAPVEAGNTWAPESVWDAAQNAFIVHWSSTLYDDERHDGRSYNRIMYATTRDFREFSKPQVWIDRGWSTIDTTVIEHDGRYYRFLKDERSRDHLAPQGKSIFCEHSGSLTAAAWTPLAEGIGLDTIRQGEGPLVYKSNTEEKWFLWIDEFTNERRYVPFETTDLASGVWTASADHRLPGDPCHGVVLPVTADEYQRLSTACFDAKGHRE